MRIRKSGCVKSNRTCCYTGKFNIALSLCGILGVALYFSENFLEVATRGLTVAEALWLLRVTIVCFLGQDSNLQSPTLQQRHRLFLKHFLCLSLVNLPLLASLEEKFTHGELNCFQEQKTEMIWRRMSWQMRPLKISLPYSRRLQ